jgi:GAG-pre-integrase domain
MTPGFHLQRHEIYFHLDMATITINHITIMIYKISITMKTNQQRKSSSLQTKFNPCFYFAQGLFQFPEQAFCFSDFPIYHNALRSCQAFTAYKGGYKTSKLLPFDSDSFQMKIDNCASKCITNNLSDFQTLPDPVSLNITGVGGNILCTHIGTVNWTIEDDQGMQHAFIIPGTNYAPQAPHHLLSPQHWSQTANDHHPTTNGTWCATYSDHIILHWSQCKFMRTIPLDRSTNTATLYSAAGLTAATALCNQLIHFSPAAYAHLIPTEELDTHEQAICNEDTFPELQNGSPLELHNTSTKLLPSLDNSETLQSPPSEWLNMNFMDETSPLKDQQMESQTTSTQDLWTHWHQRLGHLSKVRMKTMAIEGRIPKQLATCEIPLCPSCIAGKSIRKPWRFKGKPLKITTSVTSPGQWVHVDQLESPTPGFIGQIKSPNLTNHRYHVTTIFVDAYTDFTFIWNQTSTNAEQTIAAKQAFERFASSNNVLIRHYHADNGRFAEPTFVNNINCKGQTISFSGVGAHHQNGVAERRIRDLQDSARAMMIHAYQRWPDAINVHL